jgi:hypothetical protein
MGELARMRERAAIGRRAFFKGLGSGAALAVGGKALWDIGVEAAAIAVDRATEERGPGSYAAWPLTPDQVWEFGSEIQLKALAAWKEGREIPPETKGRTTFTYLGNDGRHWIDHQGSEVISRLWAFGDELINVPMMEQPDRHFGAWAEGRIAEAYHRREPQYARVRAIVRDTETPRLMNYTAVLLPDGDGRVRSLSSTFAGRQREVPRPSTSIPGDDADQAFLSL